MSISSTITTKQIFTLTEEAKMMYRSGGLALVLISNDEVIKISYLTDLLGIKNSNIHYQLTPDQLHDITIKLGQGIESSTGALAINTGEFTGRSPQDRFIVRDATTEDKVWWGKVNIPFSSENFDKLYKKDSSNCLVDLKLKHLLLFDFE